MLRCTDAVRRALFTGDAESGARSAPVGITAPVGVADHLKFQLFTLVGAAGLLANGAYHGPWPSAVALWSASGSPNRVVRGLTLKPRPGAGRESHPPGRGFNVRPRTTLFGEPLALHKATADGQGPW